MFAVPSLNPKRLRGVTCARVVAEVRPNPSCDQRMDARPKAILDRLRIACTATCGSSLHAWMQRSPPVSDSMRASPGKCGRSTRAAGRRDARPKRSTPSLVRNSVGPKPKVSVRPAGGRSRASPVSSGGASSGPLAGLCAPADVPCVIRAAATVQSFRSSIRPARSRSDAVSNAAKCSLSWAAVVIPAWWSPWNAYTVAEPEPAPAVARTVRSRARPAPAPSTPAPMVAPASPSSPRRDSPGPAGPLVFSATHGPT